jgi:integrase
MASIYRQKGSKKYRIAYIDENGQRRIVPGFRDKEATKAKARDLERRAERIRAGLPVIQQEKAHEPIAAIIDAYLDDMRRRSLALYHQSESLRILNTLAEVCDWPSLSAIRRDKFSEFLATKHKAGAAPRTLNRYHETLRAFLNWCHGQSWIERSPLEGMEMYTVGHRGKRHRRRAFTIPELHRLLAATTPCRAKVYAVAAFSGLRRGELLRIQKRDANVTNLTWHLRAETTKAQREEHLPMTPDCADVLANWHAWPQKDDSDPIFLFVPHVATLHEDMKKAEIERINSAGRRLDFHSLRYTFCALLAKKLPIQEVSRLMRHSDIRLTANLYLELGLTDIAEKEWKLPKLIATPPQPAVGLPEGESDDALQ